jgi:RNAse (barnase) inhibitor barstar
VNKPTFCIDGAAFSDLEGFYDEVQNKLLLGEPWGRTREALRDLLRGEVAPAPTEFRLVWEHSDLSRQRLGERSFTELLELIAEHPNVELVLS